MLVINVNNGRKLLLSFVSGEGMRVTTVYDQNYGVERKDFIPEDELVMLYDYWMSCKDGTEKSDYIAEA